MRGQTSLMTHQELDLALLGSLMTTLHDHDADVIRGRHKPTKRARISSNFMHKGYHVCINTFAFFWYQSKPSYKGHQKTLLREWYGSTNP